MQVIENIFEPGSNRLVVEKKDHSGLKLPEIGDEKTERVAFVDHSTDRIGVGTMRAETSTSCALVAHCVRP